MKFRQGSNERDSSSSPARSSPNEFCQLNGVIIPIGTLAAPPPDEWCRPNRGRCVLHPVGTRGWVGWMRGPCACPRGDATGWPHATQTTRQASRTSTRPPPCSTSTPCPYRTQADIPTHSPIRLAKIIRVTVQTVTGFSSTGTRISGLLLVHTGFRCCLLDQREHLRRMGDDRRMA